MLAKLRVAFVLFAIGAISGLLIFGMNELTADTIATNTEEREKLIYKELFSIDKEEEIRYDKTELNGELTEEVSVYDEDDVFVGTVYKASRQNNYGNVTVLLGITPDNVISSVVISETTNTPNYVETIRSKYLEPFTGQTVSDYTIDASTGSSYTYGSVTDIIESATSYYMDRGEDND